MDQDQNQLYSTDSYDRAGADRLLGLLSTGAVLMQGPVGTMLASELGAQDVPAAYWNVAEPQEVTRIHQQYADAGAQILLTNTFQATAPALKRDHIESSVNLVCAEAVAAAHAAGGQNLVGSIGSCGIEWFHKDEPEYRLARDAYREQAHALLAAGVQACMLETFTSIRDLEPAVAGVADVADGMPMFISFAVDDEGNLLGDGLNVEAACIWAEKHGATAVGVNCCSIAAATLCVPRMASSSRGYIMVRPYASLPVRDDEGCLRWSEDAEALATASVRWATDGARIIGTCCGATPASTCAIAEELDACHRLVEE